MPNLKDARSAVLNAQAKTQDWLEQFMDGWTRPYQEATMLTWWNSIPDEVHAELERLAPDAHRKFSGFIDQMKERQTWPK